MKHDLASNKVIITSPSLAPEDNVSGVSEVVRFIITHNKERKYLHFCIGKKDTEGGGLPRRLLRIVKTYRKWKTFLTSHPDAMVHYSFPLDARSVVRDFFFIAHAYRKHRKMLVHIHGGVYLTKKKRPWIINRIMHRIFSMDVTFVVLSELERKIIQDDFYAKQVEVLPNCVDLTDAQSYTRIYHDEKPLTIGYLGRIEENKGMDWLLIATERLRREGMTFKLVLAGKEDGRDDYLEKFSLLLGPCFHYCGIVSGESKKEFLRNLDVFVLPSYFEGLPMSLLETMSYGCVPVTTSVGSISEVVRDGKNGIIIRKKDEKSIVDALRRLDANRLLFQSLSKEAKQTILTKFSPETFIKRLNKLYQ